MALLKIKDETKATSDCFYSSRCPRRWKPEECRESPGLRTHRPLFRGLFGSWNHFSSFYLLKSRKIREKRIPIKFYNRKFNRKQEIMNEIWNVS